MSTIYSQNFDALSLADLNGQDSWAQVAPHSGGSIDVVSALTNQCASLSVANTKITHYARDFSPIDRGIWYKTTFTFQANSATFPADCLIYYSTLDENGDSLWDIELAASGVMQLYDRSGTLSLGTVTEDAPHIIEVAVDENLTMTVDIDGAPVVTTGLQRLGGRPNTIALDSGPNTATAANVHYWDVLTVVARTAYNVYKYYVGK